MTLSLALVAEDKLTQAVLHKCVSEYLPGHTVIRSDVMAGRGNVQRNLAAYANLSLRMPVIVCVDLDHDVCASALLSTWRVAELAQRNLVVRVAVREIESWVLADRKRYASFVGGKSDSIPVAPDGIDDPKRFLLDFARQSASEELKRDLIPVNFSQYPRIGRAYNLRMCKFVHDRWRPHVARTRSGSLDRALRAIEAITLE
jgi:hypothetical protein